MPVRIKHALRSAIMKKMILRILLLNFIPENIASRKYIPRKINPVPLKRSG